VKSEVKNEHIEEVTPEKFEANFRNEALGLILDELPEGLQE
jgi:hypothetical protein